MKQFIVFLLLFAVFIDVGGAFNSKGEFQGTKKTLQKCLDVAMWLPEKAEWALDKLTTLDFITDVPETLPDDELDDLSYDFSLPYYVDDRAYIIYLKFVEYKDGSTGFGDFLGNVILGWERENYDIWIFEIVGNSYGNLWIGEQITIKAGAASALPRYHKIWNETLTFPDGNSYEIDRRVELPYEWFMILSVEETD